MQTTPRTAYVHVGAPKTGSTSIQAAFSEAKEQLAEQGFHYLDGDRNHSERLAMAFWTEADAVNLGKYRWIDDRSAFLKFRADLRADLAHEFAQSAPHDLIISAEEVSDFRAVEVDGMLAFLRSHYDEVKIIAYAREPQSWMNSAAQQGAKWSGDILDTAFTSPRVPEYRRRFQKFVDAVGRENFKLRVFCPEHPGFDVVADFAKVLGISALFPMTGKPRMNSAVSHRTAVMFSAVNNRLPPFVDYRANPCRAFNFASESSLPGRKFELPRESILASADRIDEEHDWLNDMFGCRVFDRADLPAMGLRDWFGDERAELERFGLAFSELCRKAQNESALRSLWQAQKHRRGNHELADRLLTDACMLATDRWTLHLIATEAVEHDHPSKRRFFAKQRLMRQIEEPEAGAPTLYTGNPFQRDLAA